MKEGGEQLLKLLFIEDEADAVAPILNLIKRKNMDMQSEICGFGNVEDKIASFRPDIVILDLFVGVPSDHDPEGFKICNFIWDQNFCPIVVYSARSDIYDKNYAPHPFMKSVQKGSGSPPKVLAALGELRPQVDALHDAKEKIQRSFSLAMRDVAPYAFDLFKDADRRKDVILRAGRRRLAALMDDFAASGDRLAAWEQYLSPPIAQNIKLGDILMKADGKNNDPASFRVVLTPSCDLAATEGRRPKVDKVLVACCCSIREGLDLTRLKGIAISKLKKDLPGMILSPGYYESIIPFPGLEGRIPEMTANLRNLEFIPVTGIGISGKNFLRIASIDSPFRELVAWAYLQIACRPGIPDRDFDSWRDNIVALLKSEGDGKQT